jgi:group I intron endonuclease
MIGYIYYLKSPSDKFYIGQTININNRWNKYKCIRKELCRQPHLFNSLKKYGPENFEYEILDICYDQEELDDAEKYWIRYYNSVENGYNIRNGGKNGRGMTESGRKILSEKSKLQWKTMSQEQKNYIINQTKKANIGKKASYETKLKMSMSRKGKSTWNKGIPATKETIEKLKNNMNKKETIENNIITHIKYKYEINDLKLNKKYITYSLNLFCKRFNINYSGFKKNAIKNTIYKNQFSVHRIPLDQTDLNLIQSKDSKLLTIQEF